MMPKMNGIAACAEIRKSDPLVPILFFTAMPSDVGAVRALGLGADDYIDKAKSPEELLARVAATLRRASAVAKTRADALALGGALLFLIVFIPVWLQNGISKMATHRPIPFPPFHPTISTEPTGYHSIKFFAQLSFKKARSPFLHPRTLSPAATV